MSIHRFTRLCRHYRDAHIILVIGVVKGGQSALFRRGHFHRSVTEAALSREKQVGGINVEGVVLDIVDALDRLRFLHISTRNFGVY